jgi:hypothetical protein
MKIGKALFVAVFLLMVGATVGYCLGTSVQLFFKYTNDLKPGIYAGFLVNFAVIAVEALCAAVGMVIFLNRSRKNAFLLIALVLSLVNFRVYTNTFVSLFIDFGLISPWGTVGVGVNFIGVVLLAWYLLLRQET